jgi:hypothetical protein
VLTKPARSWIYFPLLAQTVSLELTLLRRGEQPLTRMRVAIWEPRESGGAGHRGADAGPRRLTGCELSIICTQGQVTGVFASVRKVWDNNHLHGEWAACLSQLPKRGGVAYGEGYEWDYRLYRRVVPAQSGAGWLGVPNHLSG